MKITINGLSAESLEKAATKVRRQQQKYVDGNRDFVKGLVRVGIDHASGALTPSGDKNTEPPDFQTRNPHVMMGTKEGSMTANITLEGEDAIFVEFGAGIFYNGHPNSSPHENGVKLGYTIGSYGLHQGLQEQWFYKDEKGEQQMSRGVEATMPLFRARQAIESNYVDTAKSVFGG